MSAIRFEGFEVDTLPGAPPESTGAPFTIGPIGSSLTISPGGSYALGFEYGDVDDSQIQVIVSFGGASSYLVITIDVDADSGTVVLPFTIDPSVCDNLEQVYHDISCNEALQGLDDSVSDYIAQTIGLACGSVGPAGGAGGAGGTGGATTTPNSSSEDGTGDTSDDGPHYLDVAGFFFYAQFAVNDDNTVIEATQDGSPLSSIFSMTFGNSNFSESCSLTVDLVGMTNAEFAADIGAWFGMEVDIGDGVTDCDNLDPSYDIVAAWGSYEPMQVYITSAPSTDAADALASNYGITAEYAVGASVLSEVLPYADDSLAGAAYQLDDAYEIVPDADGYGIPLLAYTIPRADGGVSRAFYQLTAWSSWTFN